MFINARRLDWRYRGNIRAGLRHLVFVLQAANPNVRSNLGEDHACSFPAGLDGVRHRKKPAKHRGLSRKLVGLNQQRAGAVYHARTARAYHADGTDPLVGSMQVLAQHPHYLHADVAMFPQELHQVLSADKHYLRVVQQFCRDLVRRVRECRAEAQDFSRACDPQGKPFSRIGANGQLGPSIAQNINAADRSPFGEQDRTSGVRGERFDFVERFQRIRGHIAKEPVGAEIAGQATRRLNHALHDRGNTSSPVATQ